MIFRELTRPWPEAGNRRVPGATPGKTAIGFVPEPESGDPVHVGYSQLHRGVSETVAVLRGSPGPDGRRPGGAAHADGARTGGHDAGLCRARVIHSQAFGGLSGTACGHRIADSGSRVLITMDGYYRGGQLAEKVKAGEAVAAARQEG